MTTACEPSENKIPSLRPHPTQQCNVHQYIPLLLLLLLLFSLNSVFQTLIQVQAVQALTRTIAASIQHRTLNFNWPWRPDRFYSPSSILIFGRGGGGG